MAGSRRIDPRGLAPDAPLAAVMAHRRVGARAAVSLEHDSRTLQGFEGEPLAITCVAHGIDTLARSVKFHRPRGPSCLQAACDGCLTRVDGVPNVMSCRVPARDGARVESQNAFPNASLDVLRVTDWFFPKHFDHHHLMVKFGTALNRTMQVFARRMAGLGTLPETAGATPPIEALDRDVLVVGAGPAGLAASIDLARAGLRVLLLDEDDEPGGTLLDDTGLLPGGVLPLRLAEALVRAARDAGVEIRTATSATATFDNGTLAIASDHALRVSARARVFANGAHAQIGAFPGNDLPGVYTARAAARALAYGVTVGRRIVLVGNEVPAPALAEAFRSAGVEIEAFPHATIEAVEGRSHVTRVRVASGGSVHKRGCDAVVVGAEATPAYELLGQAGIAIVPEAARACFAPRVADDGSTERHDVFAAGSVRARVAPFDLVDAAKPLEAGGPIADGRRVAKSVLEALRGGVAAHVEAAR